MWLWVGLAGAAGSVVRYGVDAVVTARWAPRFPWATLGVNVTGSLVLGFVTGLVAFGGHPSVLAGVVGTGFCGGYTTFSTTSFQTVRLLQLQRYRAAALSAVGTLLMTMAAGGLGLWLSAQ